MSALDWIAVAIVVVMSSARITRLLTFDKFPPIRWARNKYLDATDGSGWDLLALCPYCMSFWVTLGIVAWGHYTDWNQSWWLVNFIFGASYLAAIVMVFDGDDGDEGESDI